MLDSSLLSEIPHFCLTELQFFLIGLLRGWQVCIGSALGLVGLMLVDCDWVR